MDGLAQLAPHALEISEIETCHDDAERVIEVFGDPNRLVSVSLSLVEYTAFGENARQVAVRHNGRKHGKPEPLTGRLVA